MKGKKMKPGYEVCGRCNGDGEVQVGCNWQIQTCDVCKGTGRVKIKGAKGKPKQKKYKVFLNRNWRDRNENMEPDIVTVAIELLPDALVKANDLENLFFKTQNDGGSWLKNEGVTSYGKRSLSVGDIVQDTETEQWFIVDNFGFKEVTGQIFLPDPEHRCEFCLNAAAVEVSIPMSNEVFNPLNKKLCPMCLYPFLRGVVSVQIRECESLDIYNFEFFALGNSNE